MPDASMQPPLCPRCRQVTPIPVPSSCPSCGETLLQLVAPPVEQPSGGSVRGPHLTRYLPDGKTVHFPLGVKTTLGRHPENAVRLQDREVSKEHACIERLGSAFLLKDLGS